MGTTDESILDDCPSYAGHQPSTLLTPLGAKENGDTYAQDEVALFTRQRRLYALFECDHSHEERFRFNAGETEQRSVNNAV